MQNEPLKYDRIGVGYNTTRTADPYLLSRIVFHLDPAPSGNYLDVGCGTGNYTIALAEKGLHFTGIDPSAEMLNKARERSDKVTWLSGKSEALPFDDNSFDGAIATLTVHHWNDRAQGLREVFRVLKTGSHLVILTSDHQQMESYWLNHYFPETMRRATENMPAADDTVSKLEAAGFSDIQREKFFVTNELQDMFLQSGKYRPEIYFDPRIRAGISTFALLAAADEVASGLAKLRYDIDNDLFTEVQQRYESDHGDYLFIIASVAK